MAVTRNDISCWVCWRHCDTCANTVLDERLSKDHPYIYVAPKEVCKNTEHLEQEFQTIIDKGGEGIILRDPSALLQKGRSAAYLKHKV